MKIHRYIAAVLLCALMLQASPNAYALSTVHHGYLIGRRLCQAILAPFQGICYDGPVKIKHAYIGEAWKQEKPEKNGRFFLKVRGVLRAPGEEAKGIVGGIKKSADNSATPQQNSSRWSREINTHKNSICRISR
jgi:hypothetical protein